MRKWLALAVNIESVKKLPNEGIHRSAIFLESVPNVSAAQHFNMFRSNVAVALFVTNVFNVVTRGGARGTGWDGLCIVFYGPKRDGIWGTYDLGTSVIGDHIVVRPVDV